MAVLATSGLTLPKNIADGLWKKAQTGSAIAALSGSEPQKFGEVTHMTLTGRPRAELVGEGAQKGDTNATFGSKVVTPHKFQVTMRFNEEVQWADEDYQLGVLQTLSEEGAAALARALDLGGFHGINPRAGTVAAGIVAGDRIASTTNAVEITTATLTTPDIVIEQAAGLVIADGFIPNGIAFDPTYSWTVATARYADGRRSTPSSASARTSRRSRASPPTRPAPSRACPRRRRTRTSRRSSASGTRSAGACSATSRSS